MSVKLLTANHLEFLSLKGGCTSSSESILVKMPHCWKSHVEAQRHASPPPLFTECVQMRIQDFWKGGHMYQGHSQRLYHVEPHGKNMEN